MVLTCSCSIFPSREKREKKREKKRELRDSRILTKIQNRSAQLFKDTSDTTDRKTAIDPVFIGLYTDTATFLSRIEELEFLSRAKYDLVNNSLISTERRNHELQIINDGYRRVINQLKPGKFIQTDIPLVSKTGDYVFNFSFDPDAKSQLSISGWIKNKTITITKTITIKEYIEPTKWQAFKALWMYWVPSLVAIIILIVLKFLLKW